MGSEVMQSRLAFRGGPLDGETRKTQPGWPAPSAYTSPECRKWYFRDEVIVDDDQGVVTHFYDYEGDQNE